MKNKIKKLKERCPTEKEIMLDITRTLEGRGWTVWRMPPSIYSKKGIPDLCCMKNGLVAWIEVKSRNGKLSDSQRKCAMEVDRAGLIYICARSALFAKTLCDNIVIDCNGIEIIPQRKMKLKVHIEPIVGI